MRTFLKLSPAHSKTQTHLQDASTHTQTHTHTYPGTYPLLKIQTHIQCTHACTLRGTPTHTPKFTQTHAHTHNPEGSRTPNGTGSQYKSTPLMASSLTANQCPYNPALRNACGHTHAKGWPTLAATHRSLTAGHPVPPDTPSQGTEGEKVAGASGEPKDERPAQGTGMDLRVRFLLWGIDILMAATDHRESLGPTHHCRCRWRSVRKGACNWH